MNEITDLERVYLAYPIVDIPVETFKKMLMSKVVSTLTDNGQSSVTAADVRYMCVRVYEKIVNQYKTFRWLEVKKVFERGIEEDFGSFTRVTVKVLLSWFRKMEIELRNNMKRNEDSKRIKPDNELVDSKLAGRWGRFIRFSISRDIPEEIYQAMTIEEFEKGAYDAYPSRNCNEFNLLTTKSSRLCQ